MVVRRVPKRNASILSRSAALSAAEIQIVFRIGCYIRLSLAAIALHPENIALKLLVLKLWRMRQRICAPMVLTRTILQPKNRTIQSLEWGDDYIRELFMFNDRNQLRAALISLRAPMTLKLFGTNTGVVDSEFAFLLYLYRMANRAKLTVMSTVFGEDYSVISRALAAFGAWLHDAHSHRLTDALHFWSQYVTSFNLRIMERGIPLAYNRVWAFVDATLVCTARPSDVALAIFPPAPAAPIIWDVDAQYEFYCKYAMSHGLKWQAVVGPCGLILDLCGCSFGSHHDSRLFSESQLFQRLLEMHWADLGLRAMGDYYQLMGDSAYSNGPVVIRVPGGRSPDAARCSAVRVAVEHAFSKIYTKCRSMDWSDNARLFSGQRIMEMFYNCALLCNIHTCLNGSQIGNYFNCACPSLEDYMGFARR